MENINYNDYNNNYNIIANNEELDSFNLLNDDEAAPAPELNANNNDNIKNDYTAAPELDVNNINNNKANEFSIFDNVEEEFNSREAVIRAITELTLRKNDLEKKFKELDHQIMAKIGRGRVLGNYFKTPVLVEGFKNKKGEPSLFDLRNSLVKFMRNKERYFKEYERKAEEYKNNIEKNDFQALQIMKSFRTFAKFFVEKFEYEIDLLTALNRLLNLVVMYFYDYKKLCKEYGEDHKLVDAVLLEKEKYILKITNIVEKLENIYIL